jgi:transglutaminase-like putative cysteine protease
VLYDIIHKTTFSYEEMVSVSHHVLHLTPREHPQQTCHETETVVDPKPAVDSVGEDYFGNPIQHLTVQKPHKQLIVEAHSRVEVRPVAERLELEQSLPWETVAEQLATLESLEAYEYVFDSPYVAGDDAIREYALESFEAGRPILAATMDLTGRIFREFQYRGGVSDVSTPVADVFTMRQGVCQDFAHLMIACLRGLGLAARYVSGYLLTRPPEGKEKLVGSDASHAWVSVFAGPLGWVDFDPTNNVIPGVEHITFAWGRDYGDVSPINGFIVGGGAHQVSVAVDVDVSPQAKR